MFRRLFCKHKWRFVAWDYYNPLSHGLKKPLYECGKCKKRKFILRKPPIGRHLPL